MPELLEEQPTLLEKKVQISRCFKGKLLSYHSLDDVLSGNDVRDAAKRTLKDFNDAAAFVVEVIQVKRQDKEHPYAEAIEDFLKKNKNANSAHDLLEPLTMHTSALTERRLNAFPAELADRLATLKQSRQVLFDFTEKYPWCSVELRRKIFQKAMEKIKHHDELVAIWRDGEKLGADFQILNDLGKTFKRLKDLVKKNAEQLTSNRESDPLLNTLLLELETIQPRQGASWLKSWLQKDFYHASIVEELFKTFGYGEPGKVNWLKDREKWIQDNPKFWILWEQFFYPLERFGWTDPGLPAIVALHVAPTLQAIYQKDGFWGVCKALNPNFKKEKYKTNLKDSIPFKRNYKRDHRALLAVRACGKWLVSQWQPNVAFQDLPTDMVLPVNPLERKQKRQIEAAWDKLLEDNPPLKDLMEKQLLFRNKYKEYKRKPRLTLPNIEKHPEWLDFKKGDSYKNLNFERNTVDLLVAVHENETDRYRWQTFHFGLDQRFRHLTQEKVTLTGKADKETGEIKQKDAVLYRWEDPRTKEISWIDVKGIKLVMKRNKPELVFRFETDKIFPKKANDPTKGKTKVGTITLAVDMGQKYEAAMTAYIQTENGPQPLQFKPHYLKKRKGKKPNQNSKPVSAYVFSVPGAKFSHIASIQKLISARTSRHAKRIDQLFKKRVLNDPRQTPHLENENGTKQSDKKVGRFITRGTRNHRKLRDYLVNVKEARVKKTVSVILKTAIQLRQEQLALGNTMPDSAMVIVHENLANYKQNLKYEKMQNQRLQIWSVQEIFKRLEQLAEGYGLIVSGVGPAYTSQLCSLCHSWGQRFNVPNHRDWEKRLQDFAKQEKIELPKQDAWDKRMTWLAKLEQSPEGQKLLSKYPRVPYYHPGGDFFCCSNSNCSGLADEKQNRFDAEGIPLHLYTVNADVNASRNLNIKFHEKLNFTQLYKPTDEQKKAASSRIEAFLRLYYGKPKPKELPQV